MLLISSTVGSSDDEVVLESDVAFKKALVSQTVQLTCCFTLKAKHTSLTYTWIKHFYDSEYAMNYTVLGDPNKQSLPFHKTCGNLTLKSVDPTNSGFYQCRLTGIEPELYTHGTYLQVYREYMGLCDLYGEMKSSKR